MPLVRYEVRCEHSLANPELYRTSLRDDSEGLLEGVAIAGLVGLVRQLGDLAEFASEIFHDLHDDILEVVSRGKNLKARVTRLEADLPVVEKSLLAKASQFRFAYTARSKWRAPLPMDQGLCAKGELPRFVRNFYDDCRGPPRLFLLDKFDADGRGACVKRYTDPTFFRLAWATSQLEKAEQIERERQEQAQQAQQQAQQAQQEKTSKVKKAAKAGPVYPSSRERLSSAHLENLEGFTGDFAPASKALLSKRLHQVPETPDTPKKHSPKTFFQKQRPRPRPQLPEVDQGPVLAPLKISAKDIERVHQDEEGASEGEAGGSDYYADAMTTVGSDDGRWSARKSVDSGRVSVDSSSSEHGSHDRSSVVESERASVLKGNEREHHDDDDDDDDDDDELARRLDLQEPEWPARTGNANVAAKAVPRESLKGSEKFPEKDTFQLRGPQGVAPEGRVRLRVDVSQAEQMALVNEEPPAATTPRSRRQWAIDNGSQAQTSTLLSMVGIDRRGGSGSPRGLLPGQGVNEGSDLASRLRARFLESTRVIIPPQGEAQEGYDSSNTSSPYTNLSPSSMVEDGEEEEEEDGFTSDSVGSSPKGPSFCTLLSPPESPPRGQVRGLMGSPALNYSIPSSPRAPPITPFLSFSPSVSRSSSIKHDAAASFGERVSQGVNFVRSSLSPQVSDFPAAGLGESSDQIKNILVTHSRRASDSGGSELEPSRSQDQTSTVPNPASRPRTWVDRSESNVAATLRAIRQAAAVASDEETGSGCLRPKKEAA